PSFRHGRICHLLVYRRGDPLVGGQCGHEVGAKPYPVFECCSSGVRTLINLVGLSSEEDRADGHASFNDKAVYCAMVSVQLPAPWCVLIRRPVQGEVVAELVQDTLEPHDFSKETIHQHHPMCEL